MVDVGQVAPKSAVLDTTCYTKVPFSAGWCACDPAPPGHEVPAFTEWLTLTGDIRMRRGDNDIRNPIDDNVQRIDGDIACSIVHGTSLLVNNDFPIWQKYRLVWLPGNDDRLSVNEKTDDL